MDIDKKRGNYQTTKPNELPAKNDYKEMVEELIIVIQKHLF